jgi:hypothetical protein
MAAGKNALAEVVVPGVVELAVAPISAAAEMGRWCAARGIEPGSFSAPSPAVDEIQRIQFKAARKAEQLPLGAPNVMVLDANDLFVQAALSGAMPEALISALEEIVYDRPEIAFLVVGTDDFGSREAQSVAVEGHRYSRGILGGMVRQRILLRNEYAEVAMPMATELKIRRAFEIA